MLNFLILTFFDLPNFHATSFMSLLKKVKESIIKQVTSNFVL